MFYKKNTIDFWMTSLKMYSELNDKNRNTLEMLSRSSPYFKIGLRLKMDPPELNYTSSNASKKSESSKILMDELTAKGFHFSKSILTNKYRYNIYNLSIVFLFVNKIDFLIKTNSTVQVLNELKFESIIEILFLHLMDEFQSQREKTSKFFTFFNKTAKNVIKYYLKKINELPNNLLKTKILEKEFVVLMQYIVGENTKLGETAEKICSQFCFSYPFLFGNFKILKSTEKLIDGIQVSLNKKFSAEPLSMNLQDFDQNLSFPSLYKEAYSKLGKLLKLIFTLFVKFKIQNEYLSKKVLKIFLSNQVTKESQSKASICFFSFLSKIETPIEEKTLELEETSFNIGLMDAQVVDQIFESKSSLKREIRGEY